MSSMSSMAVDGAAASRSGCMEYEGQRCTLAGWRGTVVTSARSEALGKETPLVDEPMEAFVSRTGSLQCRNTVKRCAACGKVCAASLDTCNGCGQSLADTAVTTTHNVFMGFVHGVRSGPFPYRISLRAEHVDTLVFDDPLAICPAHVCSVPTDLYCPSARELYAKPKEALEVVSRLENAAWSALKFEYLADPKWRRATFAGTLTDVDRTHVIAGFNVPPSQFQLHLQYMLPPLLPWQYKLYREGAHYTKGRFLPLEYVKETLAKLAETGQSIKDGATLDIPDLAKRLEDLTGVSYDEVHEACYRRVEASQRLLAKYDTADFSYLVADNSNAVVAMLDDQGAPQPLPGPDDEAPPLPKGDDLGKADKVALQNYGRPYGDDGKPSGVYYSYAKTTVPLPCL